VKTKTDMAYFRAVEGSMTSEDGQTFMLHVKRPTGGDLLLGFPYAEIPNIVENAAMQAAHGRDKKGRASLSALKPTSFQVGRSENGEPVLTMIVGAGGKISFLLPDDTAGQLSQALRKLANQNAIDSAPV